MPHPLRRTLSGALAVTILAAACSSPSSGESGAEVTTAPTDKAPQSATASVAPTQTPTPTPTAPSEPITLAFVGDMNFEYDIRGRLDADPGSVFGASLPLLGTADLTFGNLETAITERGVPEPKEFTFRAPATAFDALEVAGFDAVSMANNHAVDFGAEGLSDTLAAIEQTDVGVAGIGANAAAAYAPVYLEAKGQRVAFLAALQLEDHTWQTWGATDTSGGVARYDDRFVDAVRAADEQADLTIAYLHWEPENETCPDPEVAPVIADELIAAGADIVVGAHAHMLQGAGWRNSTFVAYGLGNYLWYVQRSEVTTRTGIFTVTVEDGAAVDYAYAPARIQTTGGDPLPLAGADAADAQARFDELRSCTNLSATRTPPA